jgi:hypothetical protein
MEPLDTDIYVDTVSKLIRLTVEGQILWARRESSLLGQTKPTQRAFEASFRDQRFVVEAVNPGFGVAPLPETPEYRLRIERPNGVVISFPRLVALQDLVDAIERSDLSQLEEVRRLLES